MQQYKNWFKPFVLITGYYNLLGGILGIALFKWMFKILFNLDFIASRDKYLFLNHLLLFGFIAIIGWGLIKASANLKQHFFLLLISAVGKTFAALTWFATYLKEGYSLPLVGAGLTDLSIAVVYFYIYYQYKHE